MSEFVYVLVAGMVLLVAGGIFAGYATDSPAGPGGDAQGLFYENIGTIGTADDVKPTARRVRFGDVTVEETSPNATVHEQDEIRVRNTALSATSELIEFEAQQPQRAYISFIPDRMSAPEQLIVTVNGEQVDVPSFQRGERTVIGIPGEYLEQGANVVELSAANPGWAVWQRPTFVLRNAEIILNDVTHDRVYLPFRVHEYEVRGFDRGELMFEMNENPVITDDLEILINGQTVAERTPVDYPETYNIPFFANTTGISPGENVLTLKTAGEGYYSLSNLRLDLYHYATTQRQTVTRTIDIDEQTYSRLEDPERTGRFTFDIERIYLERPLTIRLNDRTYEFTPSMGRNSRTFSTDDVQVGENELQITTAGSYRIENFNMTVARTG